MRTSARLHEGPASFWPAKRVWPYLGFLLPVAFIAVCGWLAQRTDQGAGLWAWFPLVLIFGAVPLLDWLLGCNAENPGPGAEASVRKFTAFRVLPALALPILVGLHAWAVSLIAGGALGTLGTIGWTCSLGSVSGIVGITAAHELIHRRSSWERALGGALLSMVCYSGFKIEHVRGHHVAVGTPEDTSTARLGQSVYAFVMASLWKNPLRAWHLEAQRLSRSARSPWSPANELIWWHGMSLALGVLAWLGFGWTGLGYFLGQSLVAVSLLEVINYIEHYGLMRRLGKDGRYERVSPRHSWNSDAILSNLLLLQLPRHSDHHAHAARPYQLLRSHPESPQLPAGYAAMVLVALIPALWRRVMDRRAREALRMSA